MRGFTLAEVVIILVLVGTLLATGVSGVAALREAAALRSAARQVVSTLSLGRRLAVNRRETVRFRDAPDELVLTTSDDRPVVRLPLRGPDRLPVDSVRIRPPVMRFNARGQAAPGSVYLYRRGRSIRVVCNFLGRLRIEPVVRLP